jgi:hypothetical protein
MQPRCSCRSALFSNIERNFAKQLRVAVGTRRYKRKDPAAPKRPGNAYTLFVADNRNKLATEGMSNQQVMTAVATAWKTLSDAERAPYEDRAKIERDRYMDAVKRFRAQKRAAAVAAGMSYDSEDEEEQVEDDDDMHHLGSSLVPTSSALSSTLQAAIPVLTAGDRVPNEQITSLLQSLSDVGNPDASSLAKKKLVSTMTGKVPGKPMPGKGRKD